VLLINTLDNGKWLNGFTARYGNAGYGTNIQIAMTKFFMCSTGEQPGYAINGV